MNVLAPIFFGLCLVLSAHFAYGFTCIGASNSWMMSGNLSPCDTYQLLIRLCNPTFALGTLSYAEQHATGPDACGCNTVAASLAAACSDCQNSGTYDGPLYSWYLTANTGGTNHCTSITNGSISTTVSLPDTLRQNIPTWAYIDINLFGGFWSYSNAHTVAFGGSLSSTFTTSTASETNSVVTQTTTPTTSPTSTGVPLAAVVGGAVGGFALLVGVVIIVLLWMRKRNQKSTEKAFLAHRETPTTSYYSQPQSPTTPNYGQLESTIERYKRPGVLEHYPSPSYLTKTPDPSGPYAPVNLSPTLAASEPPSLTYSPPPPRTPANATGYNQTSIHQTNPTPSLRSGPPAASPSPRLSASPNMGLPDYKTTYNH